MLLSIIVTHHQTPAILKLCLKSMRAHIGDVAHEIYVVDSETQPDMQESVRKAFPEVKLISFPKNVGYAKIVNGGLKVAQGKYILILNADIFTLKDSVNRLIDCLEQNPKIGLVGPRLLTFANKRQDSCFRFPALGAILARRTFFKKFEWGREQLDRFLYRDMDLTKQQKVDWVQGSAMLVRKEAVDKVGLLDERFFMYLEDTDWCRRFYEQGYEVAYLPAASMHHYYYRNSKKWGGFLDIFLNKYTRIHLASTIKYFLKYR